MPATSVCKRREGSRSGREQDHWEGARCKWKILTSPEMRKSWNLHLVALLGDATCCLRGDVLCDRHGGHGLQRRRVCSGEAAAHALVDGTIPGEAAVLCQCALLAAHWKETTQSLNYQSQRPPVTHMRLPTQCSAEAQGAKFLSNLLRKSYCLFWESWGKSQLHIEGKTIEEETLQLISLIPLLLPNTETKVSGSKPVSSKQEEVKRRTITLLSEDSPFILLLQDTPFLLSASWELRPPSGSIYTSVFLACDDFLS